MRATYPTQHGQQHTRPTWLPTGVFVMLVVLGTALNRYTQHCPTAITGLLPPLYRREGGAGRKHHPGRDKQKRSQYPMAM